MQVPVKTLKNGTSLPCLGLGTWLMGGDTQASYTAQDAVDITAIRYAIDHGITHIDTAEIYGAGHAEELVGEAIKPFDRTSLFLASKASPQHHGTTTFPEALDASLKRMGTDYLDIYYLHRPSTDIPFSETAEAINRAYRDGKIKHAGVCNFSARHFDELQSLLEPKIIVNQVHYNLAFREPESSGLIEHAVANDYFIMAWRPLRLVKRNAEHVAVPHNIWEKGAFPLVDELAAKYQKTNVQIALAWTTHHPNIVTLIKSSEPHHIDEALGSFDFTLSAEDILKLSRDFTPQFTTSDTISLL